jgi:hypothetical protein
MSKRLWNKEGDWERECVKERKEERENNKKIVSSVNSEYARLPIYYSH